MQVGTLVVLVIALAVAGCDDGCKNGATRCDGVAVQVCDSGGHWRFAYDCDGMYAEEPWGCCTVDTYGPDCAPISECEDAGM